MKNMSFTSTNPFSTDYMSQQQDQLSKDYQDQQSELDTLYQNKLLSQDEYQQKSLELQQDYSDKQKDISTKQTQEQMSDMGDIAGFFAQAMGDAAGKQSGAYQAIFAVQKSFSIASATLDLQNALMKAMDQPFPLNLESYSKAAIAGSKILTTIEGTNYSGQAHGGIDNVPGGSGSESTWILKGNERVLQPSANKDLTKFLDDYSNGSQATQSQQQPIVINAPLVINGNTGSMSDKDFNNLVRKNSRSIYLAVSDAQKRGSTTK